MSLPPTDVQQSLLLTMYTCKGRRVDSSLIASCPISFAFAWLDSRLRDYTTYVVPSNTKRRVGAIRDGRSSSGVLHGQDGQEKAPSFPLPRSLLAPVHHPSRPASLQAPSVLYSELFDYCFVFFLGTIASVRSKVA